MNDDLERVLGEVEEILTKPDFEHLLSDRTKLLKLQPHFITLARAAASHHAPYMYEDPYLMRCEICTALRALTEVKS